MKKFVLEVACFTILQLAVAALVLSFYRVDEDAYLAASRDKHALLAVRSSPRMIFVGGSNLAFGLKSSMIARALPYEPVNLALHVGLGLRFMLRETEHALRPGDVVVLSPEYQHFTGRRVDVLLQLLEQRPSSVRFVPLVYVPTLLDQGLNYAGGVVRGALSNMLGRPQTSGDDPPYFRQAFNDYGDVTAHWRMDRPRRLSSFAFEDFSPGRVASIVGALNRFHDRARARGARVFFWYPTIPSSTLEQHRQVIAHIEGQIARSLTIPVLNRPDAATMPREFFFDTHYHLTEAGAVRRTTLLIDSFRSNVETRRPIATEPEVENAGGPAS